MGKGKLRAPRRIHLEALARAGDVASDIELNHGPKIPRLAAHLWAWWLDLAATRGSNGFSPLPLTRVEIRQWQEDEGNYLAPWELRAILRLDAAYRASLQPDEDEEA